MALPQRDNPAPAFDAAAYWEKITTDHMKVAAETFAALEAPWHDWVRRAAACVQAGGKILFCGNGGSAADAQHIAAELSVKLGEGRAPIAALCLSLDPSALTACANDYGYDRIFARQVEALGREGDLLVVLSTSGNSPNILAAIDMARSMNIGVVGLSGMTGGKMKEMCDVTICIPATDTARIQEMHITLGHLFCGALERELGLVP